MYPERTGIHDSTGDLYKAYQQPTRQLRESNGKVEGATRRSQRSGASRIQISKQGTSQSHADSSAESETSSDVTSGKRSVVGCCVEDSILDRRHCGNASADAQRTDCISCRSQMVSPEISVLCGI